MTDRLVAEILYHIEAGGLSPNRISFVGHSLGEEIFKRKEIKYIPVLDEFCGTN